MATVVTGSTASEVFGTTSPVTGAAPTAVDGTDGQPLRNLKSITVVVSAASGKTLSGAGTLDAYTLDPSIGHWVRYPAGDFTVTGTARDQGFIPADVVTPRKGYIKWVPTGVTFSSGSAGVTITQLGQSSSAGAFY